MEDEHNDAPAVSAVSAPKNDEPARPKRPAKLKFPRRAPSLVIPPPRIHYVSADKTTCAQCFCFPIETPYKKRVKLHRCLHSPLTLYELAARVVDDIKFPAAFDWTPEEVADWMANVVGLPEYRNCILDNKINGRRLVLLEDPSALPEINIHYFHHIKMIVAAIRKEYGFEFVKFSRSIGLPPRYPLTHCTQFKSRTGPTWGIRQNWDSDIFKNYEKANTAKENQVNEQDEDTLNESYVEKLMNEFDENMKAGRYEDNLENEFKKTLLSIRSHIDKPIGRNLSNDGTVNGHDHELNEKTENCEGTMANECHKMSWSRDSIDDINDGSAELFCIENKDEENDEHQERSLCPCYLVSLMKNEKSLNNTKDLDQLKKREMMEKYKAMNKSHNNQKIRLKEKEYDDETRDDDETEPQERSDILRWLKILKPGPVYRDHWELVWYQESEFPKVKFGKIPGLKFHEPIPIYKRRKKEKCREYMVPRKFRLQKDIPEDLQYIWMERRPGAQTPAEIALAEAMKLKAAQKLKLTKPKKSRLDPPPVNLKDLSGPSLLLARRKMPKRKFLEFPGQPAP